MSRREKAQSGQELRPRIDFVLPSLAGDGADRVALTLLRDLDQEGFAPLLIPMNRNGPLEDLLSPDIPVVDLARPRLRQALPALLKTLRTGNADIIFSTLGYVNLAVLAMKPLLRGKLVLREANLPSISLKAAPYPRILSRGYAWLYPKADLIIATSDRMAAEIQTDFAIKPNRLTVMANPVDSAGLRRDAARNTAEISGGVPRFMAAGRLVPQKGLDRLIPLFSDMPADAHLTIFGEGPEKERLMAIVAEAGLSSRITFAGFKPSLAADYAAADAFLMPSRWKGMPNAALEALCCGTRVIATAESGGIAEVAANAPAGAVTVCDDWDAFRDALRDFAASASRKTAADTMSVRPSLLPACYQRETVQKKFMSALETLLDNPT